MHLYRHTHPGVNTAFPIGNANRKLRRACCRSGLGSAGFDKYIGRVSRLQALRSRNRVSRQLIEWRNESPSEICNLCKRVGFATCVLQRCCLPRTQVDCHQLKCSSRSVQLRIESPCTGDVIGFEFRNEELKLGSSVMPRFSSTRASSIDRGTECPWIAGISHADREWL